MRKKAKPYSEIQQHEKIMSLESGPLRIEFVFLEEGLHGKYKENDPDDRPLLRFYVLRRDADADNSNWNEVEDSSFRTCISYDTAPEHLALLLTFIFTAVTNAMQTGESIEKVCEGLSWLNGVSEQRVNDARTFTIITYK